MSPILDAHCHIFPDRLAQKAADHIGQFYHIPMNLDGRVSTLLDVGGAAGVTHFLVHSVATSPAQVRSINEFISTTVGTYPHQMIGFGALHPASHHLEQDLRQLISLGLKGIKLHPDIQQFDMDSPEALCLYQMAAAHGLPVLIHTGDYRYDFSHPRRLKRVLQLVPNLVVIAAHLGGWSVFEEAQRLLPGTPNLYVDCSSCLYALSAQKATQMIRAFGTDRVLFGTDYPMWLPDQELARFDRLDLNQKEKAQILFENAALLLGISA